MVGWDCGCLVAPAGILQQHRGPVWQPRCGGLAVPRCPSHRGCGGGRGRHGGREGGSIVPGLLLCVLEASTAASLPGWAGPEGAGDTGQQGTRGAVCVLSSRCPWPRGATASPDGFLCSPFPPSKLCLFFLFFLSG